MPTAVYMLMRNKYQKPAEPAQNSPTPKRGWRTHREPLSSIRGDTSPQKLDLASE